MGVFRFILISFTVGVAILLALPREAWLPLKVNIAVSLLGWKGFLNVVKENMATKVLGVKTTDSRDAWQALAATLSDFDIKYLHPERGIVTEDDIAEGHMYGLHLLTTGVELFAHSDHLRPGCPKYLPILICK